MTAGDGQPAVYYLAAPNTWYPAPDRLGAEVRAELDQLHTRCLTAVGEARDAGAALLQVTANGRIRFVGGGSSSAMLDSDLVDAVVHAARAGYLLCLNRPADARGSRNEPCWLPTGHPGDCEHRGWWRWSLLYGYRGPVREVCTRCTPNQHITAPADCPHRGEMTS